MYSDKVMMARVVTINTTPAADAAGQFISGAIWSCTITASIGTRRPPSSNGTTKLLAL
ncbi:hypothetical protein D3C80_2025830 [compost metagenome]